MGCKRDYALIQQNRDKLSDTLTDEQKELLEKYDDCYAELHDFHFEQVFASGIRLEMQLALTGLLWLIHISVQKRLSHSFFAL